MSTSFAFRYAYADQVNGQNRLVGEYELIRVAGELASFADAGTVHHDAALAGRI